MHESTACLIANKKTHRKQFIDGEKAKIEMIQISY